MSEHSTDITKEVMARLAGTLDPRVRLISESLVRHLHAFVREVRPTQAEWQAGIAFLTETGAMCSPTRQEFILLSDTLGVSMLVDEINHEHGLSVTESTVLGPFYLENPPVAALGSDIASDSEGVPLFVSGSVAAADGAPLAGAVIDVWHSDAEGYYDVQREGASLSARARFHADAEGRFSFWSIQPAPYPIPHDGPVGRMLLAQGRHPWRPAHVHFLIAAPGYETLVTQIFVAGDPYLDSDAVFGVKGELVRDFAPQPADTAPEGAPPGRPWVPLAFDFRLQPQQGTLAAPDAPGSTERQLTTETL